MFAGLEEDHDGVTMFITFKRQPDSPAVDPNRILAVSSTGRSSPTTFTEAHTGDSHPCDAEGGYMSHCEVDNSYVAAPMPRKGATARGARRTRRGDDLPNDENDDVEILWRQPDLGYKQQSVDASSPRHHSAMPRAKPRKQTNNNNSADISSGKQLLRMGLLLHEQPPATSRLPEIKMARLPKMD